MSFIAEIKNYLFSGGEKPAGPTAAQPVEPH